MSNAEGQVIHGGKIVGYFEYYGSSSVAPTHFFDTWAEVQEHWRTFPQAKCTCGQPPVQVWLYTEYGAGEHWLSEVCFHCHAIVGPRGIDEVWDAGREFIKGHPLGPEHQTDWAKLCGG